MKSNNFPIDNISASRKRVFGGLYRQVCGLREERTLRGVSRDLLNIHPSSFIIHPSAILPEIEIIEETETELEPLHRVIIHNDDVTPMDFVVHVLKTVFYLANDRAADIMLTAHVYGSAYVQTLAKSEAEKRINRAHFEANNAGYPLKFTHEPE